ncbi:hypothetical protein Bca101_099178 [Brassica carinata]
MVTPKLTYALAYIKTVKDKFKDTRQKFDEFLEVIADFRAEKYSVLFLVNARLCTLFSSISVSIHSCHKITIGVDQTPPKEPVTFEEAVIFVRNVKSFLDSLNMYRNNNRSRTEVLEEFDIFILRDHHDLFVEFTRVNRKKKFRVQIKSNF